MPLTLRSEKGLALTYQELDANFQGLANGAFLETTIAGTYEFDQVNATIGIDAPLVTADTIEANTSIQTPSFLNENGDDHFDAQIATEGYQKLPSGLIMQWGITGAATNNTPTGLFESFPLQFPNAALNVSATMSNATATNPNYMVWVRQLTSSGFYWVTDSTDVQSGSVYAYWQAIGY